MEWHLITCEYPPQIGGVSDYTFGLASGLAAMGDTVHVWGPEELGETPEVLGVLVHHELGRFAPRDLRRFQECLRAYKTPRLFLLQWVPHGYGYRSLNWPFCLWLWKRTLLEGDSLEIMVHEPFLSFAGTWKQMASALVHRLMTIVLLRAASRIWVSIPAWETYWRPYALGRLVPFAWLPIPSSIPVLQDPARLNALRENYAPRGEWIVGYFGNYSAPMRELLSPSLPLIAQKAGCLILLIGQGSEEMRNQLVSDHPFLADRLWATGCLPSSEVSLHLQVCDVLFQPYRDGVNSRHGSMMAGLAHGKPVVTTRGCHTEGLWEEVGAAILVSQEGPETMANAVCQLLWDEPRRLRLGQVAQAFYQAHFEVRHTIAALQHVQRSCAKIR